MALSRKPGSAGFNLRGSPGAGAPGPTGIRPAELYDGDTPGPVGLNDAAAQTALYVGGGKRGSKASRAKSRLKMKVEIIEYPTRSLFTNKDRERIRSAVSSELKRIAKKLKTSKAQFSVSWAKPKTLTVPAATPKVLQVYVIENSSKSINQAIKIRKAALPGVAGNDQELADRVGKEAGFNAKKVGGKVSVSFMSISQGQQYKQAGVQGTNDIFANIILHEIGHGMDADHPDKGVMSTKTVYSSTGGQLFQYSKESIKNIDNFLSTL